MLHKGRNFDSHSAGIIWTILSQSTLHQSTTYNDIHCIQIQFVAYSICQSSTIAVTKHLQFKLHTYVYIYIHVYMHKRDFILCNSAILFKITISTQHPKSPTSQDFTKLCDTSTSQKPSWRDRRGWLTVPQVFVYGIFLLFPNQTSKPTNQPKDDVLLCPTHFLLLFGNHTFSSIQY